ncbi:DNA mismatch repair protein MLH3 isoform X2 [Rutidosis leptorrhynchoides]|uniref:DNA mismatch repair protein MLH3 isoform X2 n=1 Tax=Rutidosis leptorrhynchoides TaxID=125765 RepID=UPI003A998A48
MRSIKLLPESVRSSMRSGIILFDLTRVVEELVFNSLDAGATKVIVAVGVGTSYIKVTDNGSGITRDGLVLLGERYATSKFEQLDGMKTVPESFGFRGEALSSISDVSLLEVVTKAHGMPNGYRKVIKGCKCLYLGIDDDRQDFGTTVVVRDLFYNQPVKRRHLQSSPKKVLHYVKECLLRIALVHLGTSFKLVDIESGLDVISLYPSSSPLPVLAKGFGVEVSQSLSKLDESDGKLKLSGYISGPYEDFSVKAFQYFYINSRYISRGPIHKLLNQLADTHWCSDLVKADCRSQCGKRARAQASPTYILNLTCPRAHYDLSFEPAKTCVEFKNWDPIFSFIKKAVSCFWSQGTHLFEQDAIWNEDDTLSTEYDLPNNYGLPKERCITRSEEQKLTPFNRYQRNNVQSEGYENVVDFDFLPNSSLNFSVAMADNLELKSKCSVELSDELMDHHSNSKWKLSDAQCSKNNRSLVKKPSTVRFHFDDAENTDDDVMRPFLRSCSSRMHVSSVSRSTKGDDHVSFHFDDAENTDDDDVMRPFLRSCSSRMHSSPVVRSTKGDDHVSFQDKSFKNWLNRDDKVDNEESDCNLQVSEPWLDDSITVWSPPKNSSLRFEGSFDSILTNRLTSPVASNKYSKSIHRSSKRDWSKFSEKMLDEPLTDDAVSTRYSKRHRDDEFDPFAYKEWETDIFNLNNMRNSSSLEDFSFLKGQKNINNSQPYETEWARSPVAAVHHMPSLSYTDRGMSKGAQCEFREKRRIRSSSAPPFYKEKNKIVALNSWMTVNSGKSNHKTSNDIPTLQETKSPGVDHLASEEGPESDFLSMSRHEKQDILDAAEMTVHETERPHFLDVYNSDSDFTFKDNLGALDIGGKWRNGCPSTSSIQTSNDLVNQDSILDISSGLLHLSDDSLLPKSMSKKCMAECKVLHQVDKKFIPVVGDGILAVIDQHAADERIRLEDLREKVFSGENKTITYLDAEQELVLPEIGYQLLNNYSDQIQKWGWICNFHAKSSVSFKKNLNFLNNQPSVATLIAVPCILGVNLTDVDLLEFLQQLADTDGSSVIPPAVLRVLNFKACRGAIMFGDALLPSECSLIVEELKQTSMCFQCAHGRPTTAPLVNLVVLHKQIAKLGNWSHGSSGPWHGLSRHKPSLERSAQRLSSEGR